VPAFTTKFQPFYQALVQEKDPPVAKAVAMAEAYESSEELEVPSVYVSTAITSGGWLHDETLSREEVIAANNRTGGMIATSLYESGDRVLAPENTMLPTELKHVHGWLDSDYILFYFCWLSGLSVSGTAWVERQLQEPQYAAILATANRATREDGKPVPNGERWPAYRVFVEVVMSNLALAEAQKKGKRADGCRFMLQLVDVEYSLGCRAEEIYADVRGLDRLAPSFAADLAPPLGPDLDKLRTLGAKVGLERHPSELVPVLLR
jgi:hypothetical protein